ncbi:unnamed protein product [Trifolium pratense]|uniref:Uncharacterized protein n=1 Tax=Trifolium pratense TaxID=57577 RepID=A0ACB0KIA6_TRIPR|nr:unnamed protein product [Trifolium pratense]
MSGDSEVLYWNSKNDMINVIIFFILFQNLVNLKEVTLYRSKLLKELPDFSKATNLGVLDASRCYQLKSIHPSVFSLDNLVRLDLEFCSSLTKFVFA